MLHPARAVVNGLDAAFLAKAGMTGPEHILEAEDGGLLAVMSDTGDIVKVSKGLGTDWEILHMDMKPYPCCRSAHCAIDCSLKLRDSILEKIGKEYDHKTLEEERKRLTEAIREIEIKTYEVGYKQCAVSDGCLHPQNTMDAKFSIPFCTAAAFLFGKVTMSEFSDQTVEDPSMQCLIEKVTVMPDEAFSAVYPAHWGCSMKVILENGIVLETQVSDPSGGENYPLTKAQILKKAENLIKICYPGKEKQIAEKLLDLAEAERLPEL